MNHSHQLSFHEEFNSPEEARQEELIELLWALDGIEQDPKHHPEKDALYHSLQVFHVALDKATDPQLWAAALFHDVGKSYEFKGHASIGGSLVEDIFTPYIGWLISHHMDLLYRPKQTRRQWAGEPRLYDLEQLRRWDCMGRSPHATVMEPEEAVALLFEHKQIFLPL